MKNINNNSMLFKHRLDTDGKNCKEETRCIVFLLKLLLQFCHLCHQPDPANTTTLCGPMISIETKFQKCQGNNLCTSQPLLLNKIPAGNLLLSLAILCVGTSIKKTLLVLRHMNVALYNKSQHYCLN